MSQTLSKPYCTLADVKRYCGEDTVTYDDDFKFGINKASRFIDGHSLRNFYKTILTDEYLPLTGRGNGWRIINEMLYTPMLLPIIAITSIYEDNTLLVENTDYYVNKETGEIERVGDWDPTPRAIKITANIGYDSTDEETPSTDIPEEITSIALELAARFSGRFNKRKVSHITGEAVNIDLYEAPKYILDELHALRPTVI
jgi:hypothetical protein